MSAPLRVSPDSDDELPFVTAELPGIGGVLRSRPEDFRVDEVPAYEPSGHGDHVFVAIEKRGLTTPMAVAALARALGVAERDVGWAGMKDRHAVTRQWLSLPPPVTPEAALAVAVDGVRVLAAVRHPHKLRTGHLRGNRFELTVRDVAAGAADRARAILARLAEPPGAPNGYGAQRFGAAGDNVAQGLAVLRGEPVRVPPKVKRLLISSVQSALFNAWLRARIVDGLYREVIDGDVVLRGVVTGPMFGSRMRGPAPGTLAATREAAVLAEAELDVSIFDAAGSLAEGTRRPLGVAIGEPSVEPSVEEADGPVVIRFTLPAGAYATTVLREVMK